MNRVFLFLIVFFSWKIRLTKYCVFFHRAHQYFYPAVTFAVAKTVLVLWTSVQCVVPPSYQNALSQFNYFIVHFLLLFGHCIIFYSYTNCVNNFALKLFWIFYLQLLCILYTYLLPCFNKVLKNLLFYFY